MRYNLSTRGAIESVCNEAIVLRPYLDSKNIWTIGIGHTAMAGPPDPARFTGEMTLKEAFELFMDVDAPKYMADVNRAVKVALAQHEVDALFDFHYNTGAIAKAALTKSLNAGNKSQAARQFLNYSKPPEIIERRRRSQELFLTGKYHQRYALLLPVNARKKPDWAKGRRIDLLNMFDAKTMVVVPPNNLPKKVTKGVANYITLGASGASVLEWQNTLISLGYTLKADSDFGPTTLKVTKAFQKANRLLVDGRVGPGTRGAANKLLEDQKKSTKVATVVKTPEPVPNAVLETTTAQPSAEPAATKPEVVANSSTSVKPVAVEQRPVDTNASSGFWATLLSLFFRR